MLQPEWLINNLIVSKYGKKEIESAAFKAVLTNTFI